MEQEKRFKIEKIEKYEKQIDKKYKEMFFNVFMGGFFALMAGVALSAGIVYGEFIPVILSSVPGGLSLHRVIKSVESIADKAILKSDVRKLKEELEMIENSEEKGRQIWLLILRIF